MANRSSTLIPSLSQVIDLHVRLIDLTGGAHGIRSHDALASAWGRVETRRHYHDDASPVGIAAAFAVSIVKAHGFVDGNKRSAYGAMILTLHMNGLEIYADRKDQVDAIIAAATGDGDPEALADWLSDRCHVNGVYEDLFAYDAAGPDLS